VSLLLRPIPYVADDVDQRRAVPAWRNLEAISSMSVSRSSVVSVMS
jgi:hypothetical protein